MDKEKKLDLAFFLSIFPFCESLLIEVYQRFGDTISWDLDFGLNERGQTYESLTLKAVLQTLISCREIETINYIMH
jgi:hypothetical protein